MILEYGTYDIFEIKKKYSDKKYNRLIGWALALEERERYNQAEAIKIALFSKKEDI